jgi:acetate kinase
MKILVANVGSTSFKYKLFDMTDESVLAEGKVERVGREDAPIEHRVPGKPPLAETRRVPDYPTAIRMAMVLITDAEHGAGVTLEEIDAVGFKTVHAGDRVGALRLDDDVLREMEAFASVAPAHNPPYLRAIRLFAELFPDLPLIGLFEPTFHATIPEHARVYGIPYEWTMKYGIRKYGFHGASHRYVSERVPQLLGRGPEDLRLVSCHLGGSSSLCAVRDGKSVDTTMGFSLQEGILNATRHGDLDAWIIPYLMDREGLTTDEIREVLSKRGGLLGISGVSGEIPEIEAAAKAGNERARLALDAFCYGVTTHIGALAAAMGGADAIAFAGGIGERGVAIREQVVAPLGFLGAKLDLEKNASGDGDRDISVDGASCAVLVIRTNEELIVARETAKTLAAQSV